MVFDKGLMFVAGMPAQAQQSEVELHSMQVWVMLRLVGVHIVGFGQVMKVRREGGFAGLLDRIRGCSKVESSSWVNRVEMAAIV
jgi:hypothetical protein